MGDWTTIRVRTDARNQAKEMKPDDLTWSEWITDESRGPEVDSDELAAAITDDLLSQLPPKIADELRQSPDQ